MLLATAVLGLAGAEWAARRTEAVLAPQTYRPFYLGDAGRAAATSPCPAAPAATPSAS